MSETANFPVLVAIETDSTQFHGENPGRPNLMDRGAAEQMLAHLASDLASLFPGIRNSRLCMAGALYDQTQILQPSYPVFDALDDLASAAGRNYATGQVSIGATDGRMPVAELQPCESVTPGLLQLLPILVSGPADQAASMSAEMEHRFLAEGQVSAHTAKALEAGFGIRVNHARLMTLTDLNALLHMQLEHFGFLPLWELLDAALNGQKEELAVQGRDGARFVWDGSRVVCEFETFDHWASHGAGRHVEGGAEDRVDAYCRWTREHRQYLITLGAHALPVAQQLAGTAGEDLSGSFLLEESNLQVDDSGQYLGVTEHGSGELGTIAVTVVDSGRVLNLYPIRPEGLNDLHAHLRTARLAAGGVSYTGTLCLDGSASHLAPDLEPKPA